MVLLELPEFSSAEGPRDDLYEGDALEHHGKLQT